MKKAGRKADSTAVMTEELQAASRIFDARQLFMSEVFGLSWRLAFTVLIPLIGGIQLDKRYDTEPLFTLLGLALAFVFGSAAVWITVKKVNELQSGSVNNMNEEN